MLNVDHPLRRGLRAARRRLSSHEAVWKRALPSEVAFWARYIETRGLDQPDEFRQRLDPTSRIEDATLLGALAAIDCDPVRILDVGAGPLTGVGFIDPNNPGRRIAITAVDPLAEEYQPLLADARIVAPVVTIACRGEDVLQTFGENAFDIAYARNSLDHAVDPVRIIDGLLRVVRVGGFVVLVHGRREAEVERYEQLHQWNFDVQDDRLVLFSRREFHDLNERFGLSAQISTKVYDGPYSAWVTATIKRTT